MIKDGIILEGVTTGDKIVFVSLLCLTLFLFFSAYNGLVKGSMVLIEVENRPFGIFPLSDDRRIRVRGPLGETIIDIKDRKVGITASPCPNKMCVKFGMIDNVGRVSICLPNKVVIKITGEDGAGNVDAVVG